MDPSQDSSQDSNPFDEGPTIAPSDLVGSSGVDTTDYSDIDGTVVNAFAMLEFPDSTIPITQSSILLGRDETIRQFESSLEALGVHPSAEGGAVAATPNKRAVLSYGDEDDESERGINQNVITALGTNQMFSAEGGTVSGFQNHNSVERKESQTGNEMRIDIHPPVDPDTGLRPLSSISKNHLRISFDAEFGWILTVLGRNGAFVNGMYKPRQDAVDDNEKVILNNGDLITVRGLEFYFWLPANVDSDFSADSALTSGESDDEEDEEEEGSNNVKLTLKFNKSGDLSDTEKKRQKKRGRSEIAVEDDSDEDDENSDDEEGTETPKAKKQKIKDAKGDFIEGKSRSSKHKPFNPDDYLRPGETLERRRGPGRPPANGVMSQREMKERKKALAAESGTVESPRTKRKRSDSNPKDSDEEEEEDLEKDGKQKKAKKKVKDEDGKEKKEKKKKGEKRAHAERPQTPPRENFTEEQLKKPEGTTQDRIYHVLQKSGKPMALQDIYLAIRNEWPAYWYMPSNGWESSVRHTLGQMPIFQQAGKAGKGAYWEINHDVPYTKKTRASHTQQTNNYSRPTPYAQSQGYQQGNQAQYPAGVNAYRPPGQYNPGYSYQNPVQRPMGYPAPPGTANFPQMGQTARPSNAPAQFPNQPQAPVYPSQANGVNPAMPAQQGAPHHTPPYPSHPNAPRPAHESNVAQIRAGRMPDLFDRFLNTLKTTGDPANRDTLQNKASRAIQWILRNNYPTVQPDDDVKAMVEILWKLACDNDNTTKVQQSRQAHQPSPQMRQQPPYGAGTPSSQQPQPQQMPTRTATPGGLPPRPPHSPVTPSQANGLAPPPSAAHPQPAATTQHFQPQTQAALQQQAALNSAQVAQSGLNQHSAPQAAMQPPSAVPTAPVKSDVPANTTTSELATSPPVRPASTETIKEAANSAQNTTQETKQ